MLLSRCAAAGRIPDCCNPVCPRRADAGPRARERSMRAPLQKGESPTGLLAIGTPSQQAPPVEQRYSPAAAAASAAKMLPCWCTGRRPATPSKTPMDPAAGHPPFSDATSHRQPRAPPPHSAHTPRNRVQRAKALPAAPKRALHLHTPTPCCYGLCVMWGNRYTLATPHTGHSVTTTWKLLQVKGRRSASGRVQSGWIRRS